MFNVFFSYYGPCVWNKDMMMMMMMMMISIMPAASMALNVKQRFGFYPSVCYIFLLTLRQLHILAVTS